MSCRVLIALAVAALALPAAAHAGSALQPGAVHGAATAPAASLEVRDVPLAGARRPAAAKPRHPFTLVGLHWRGGGSVEFRTRGAAGWSAWLPAAPEAEDLPDAATAEAAAAPGWHDGNPYWTGAADRLEVRTKGRVTAVRSYTVWSAPAEQAATPGAAPGVAVPARALASVSAARAPRGRAAAPPIALRASWGADELITKPPSYAPAVTFAVIHHTAGSNSYTPQQSAAIVRGIQLYHVSGNGWNDIGYNFLVDKYGQVFEGRRGGIDRPVIGAHAVGFNAGSVGIAVLGSYGATGISKAARGALVKLLAWRLDVAHVDPLSTLTRPSGGNARFPRGIPVFLRAVDGHRDTGFTDCPGDALYRNLDAIAASTAVTGLPKIYEPLVAGKVGGPVRFTARLSGYASWRVTVTDANGAKVAAGRGTGIAVDWTWDARRAKPGSAYSWKLESGLALPATGTVGRKPPPVTTVPPATTGPATTTTPTTPPPATPSVPATPFLTGLTLSTTVLTPDGDGSNDTATVSYTLAKSAFVTAFVLDQTGTVVAQSLFSDQKQSARTISFPWDPQALPDGRYRFVVAARLPSGEQSSGGVDVLVARTLSAIGVAPAAISPNGDGVADATTVSFVLARPALVTLRILAADGTVVAQPAAVQLEAGQQQIAWDGTGVAGRVPDGTYTAQVTATDSLGDVVRQTTVTVDTVAPVLTLVSGPELRFNLSESASVTVLVDGAPTSLVAGPGDFQLQPPPTRPSLVSAVATDGAGNPSATVSWP